MEIILKSGVTMCERSLRPFFDLSNTKLKNKKAKLEKQLPLLDSKASTIQEIVAIDNERELRNHPDFTQFEKEWLPIFIERCEAYKERWFKKMLQTRKRIDDLWDIYHKEQSEWKSVDDKISSCEVKLKGL